MYKEKIEEGYQVTLHFSLALEDGQIINTNFNKKPATCIIGDGNLPNNFEQLILGMSEGEENTFCVAPKNAFGLKNKNNRKTFLRSQFDKEIKIEKGLVVSFKDVSKTELPGVIIDYNDQNILVDFNHPLSGKTIIFRVKIISVEHQL